MAVGRAGYSSKRVGVCWPRLLQHMGGAHRTTNHWQIWRVMGYSTQHNAKLLLVLMKGGKRIFRLLSLCAHDADTHVFSLRWPCWRVGQFDVSEARLDDPASITAPPLLPRDRRNLMKRKKNSHRKDYHYLTDSMSDRQHGRSDGGK